MDHKYFGHETQVYGVEEHRIVGGRGDGMRLLLVKNGIGLEFTISLDRCADISRLSYRANNYGYFSVNGYVAPAYYDDKGTGWFKSFTAGFLTTCGLLTAGMSSTEDGEFLPMHGEVSNIPAENVRWEIENNQIVIKALIRHSRFFAEKLLDERTISCSLERNVVRVKDRVTNNGSERCPLMLVYHTNLGYPLLSESTKLYLPTKRVIPFNDISDKDIENWSRIEPPMKQYVEKCYYHELEDGVVKVYNSQIGSGLTINFDINQLKYFLQWKMFGEKDYVLGLEPSNCELGQREKMRRDGTLVYLNPGETKEYEVTYSILDSLSDFM